MVVEIESHFQVESHKFGQVAMGVRVFGTEDGANGEDPLKVACDCHLLVELRGLGQVGGAFEIADLKIVRFCFSFLNVFKPQKHLRLLHWQPE